ncbi:hypothetical protein ACFQ07_15535 [Actinomadura adrarensis]|uniref:RNA polymerase sigma-70 region 2 domain-containing protein n=1 Tax=Actinomadura adrarensis TaxID=1819600 RepID=A0ABW3CGJ4_9ACTN
MSANSEHAADSATETFVAHRNLLFTVAYEMLGSATDAEDARITGLYYVRNPNKLTHVATGPC